MFLCVSLSVGLGFFEAPGATSARNFHLSRLFLCCFSLKILSSRAVLSPQFWSGKYYFIFSLIIAYIFPHSRNAFVVVKNKLVRAIKHTTEDPRDWSETPEVFFSVAHFFFTFFRFLRRGRQEKKSWREKIASERYFLLVLLFFTRRRRPILSKRRVQEAKILLLSFT